MFTVNRREFVQAILASVAASPLTGQSLSSAQYDPSALRLQYSRAAQKWVEALPIGNGRVGAMVFGGVGTERLQLNEDTLWSGGPGDTGNPKSREVVPRVRAAVASGRYTEADTLAKDLQGPYTQSYLPM